MRSFGTARFVGITKVSDGDHLPSKAATGISMHHLDAKLSAKGQQFVGGDTLKA